MPDLALSKGSKRRKAWFGVAAAGILAAVLIVGNPFPAQAKATVYPIVFPLETKVTFSNTYGDDRSGGRTHEGNDLMCPKMTKELAVVSGVVTLTFESAWGNGIWLAGDDGHGYRYLHINNDTPGTDDGKGGRENAFAPGLQSGMRVKQGQFIAYAGDSGNAEDAGSHLHFEIHKTTLRESDSIDPYDSLVAAPLYNGTTPPPPPAPSGVTRYEQNAAEIQYLGSWVNFTTSGATGGAYRYLESPGRAFIWFEGTKLDLIATKGTYQGKGNVYLDGKFRATVDFSATATLRQQKVFSTGALTTGTHQIMITWLGKAGVKGGTRINIDAVDVTGKLVKAAAITTVQQSDIRLLYSGTWTKNEKNTAASGGSFSYANKTGASVTINFTGTYFAWVTKKSPVYGIARVKLDGKPAVLVDLYDSTTKWQQPVWNTGILTNGPHKVVITWTGTKRAAATATNIGIDAVQVLGKLN